jgi:hypothetical protein
MRRAKTRKTSQAAPGPKIITDLNTFTNILEEKCAYDPYQGYRRVKTGHGKESLPACPKHPANIATARVRCPRCEEEKRKPYLGRWVQGFCSPLSSPPPPPPKPVPSGPCLIYEHLQKEKEDIQEILWKEDINNFIAKRINYEEQEAIRTAADLRHNMLIEQHQDHLQTGGFLEEKNQHQLDIQMLEEDMQHRIDNITAAVGANEYETYDNLYQQWLSNTTLTRNQSEERELPTKEKPEEREDEYFPAPARGYPARYHIGGEKSR